MLTFKRCDQVTAAVAAVMAHIEKWPLGTVLTWDTIEAVTGGFRRDVHPKWNAFARRLKNRVQKERGITLDHRSNGDYGWTLLTPLQTLTDLPAKRMRKALRQAHFTTKAVNALDDTTLPMNERVRKARVLERTKNAARGVRAARKAFLTPEPERVHRPRPSQQ